MKVKDVMHKGVDWVSPETPVPELAKLMCEHDIGAIPIGENDRLIGMVTDRDIVCKGLAQDKFDASRATARDVMTANIHCCREDEDLARAVRHMEELKVRRLPVINKNKRMIGMLSLGRRRRSNSCQRASRAFRRIISEGHDLARREMSAGCLLNMEADLGSGLVTRSEGEDIVHAQQVLQAGVDPHASSAGDWP